MAGVGLLLALAAGALPAVAQEVDGKMWVTDGHVYAIVRDGNTIYIGGQFGLVGPATGMAVPLSAATGTVVEPCPRVNGRVTVVVPDGAGGSYLAGDFTRLGDETRRGLARVLADGSVAAWDAGEILGTVHALALAGNTVYIGGLFWQVGEEPRNNIAALDAITGAVTVWNPDADGGVGALAVSGNTVYAGGSFTNIGGLERVRIAALDTATGEATAWDPTADAPVDKIVVSGATIYAAASFTNIGGQWRSYIAALDAATGLATAWNAGATGPVSTMAMSGNTIYVGGSFTMIGGQTRNRIAALDATVNTNNATAAGRPSARSGPSCRAGSRRAGSCASCPTPPPAARGSTLPSPGARRCG